MKKFIIVALAILGILLLFSSCGNQYKESDAGRKVSIRWELVNLRENHSSKSDIIEKLYYGDEVTLTGNYYEYFGGEGLPTESWKEITTSSGETGWVVTVSINWN